MGIKRFKLEYDCNYTVGGTLCAFLADEYCSRRLVFTSPASVIPQEVYMTLILLIPPGM